jgi:DDE family transposase
MTQGVLPFQYEVSGAACGMTALAGLPAYLDLAAVSGLTAAIRRHLKVGAERQQGWTDEQVVMSLVLLNLAGGDCVDDLKVLEGDEGFARVLRQVELHGRKRKERRALERRWRKERRRAVPSPSAVFRYLEKFHAPEEEAKRVEGKAFIPASTEVLKALYRVNRELVAFKQAKTPQKVATLDMDATLIETYKRLALFCYQGYAAYQPLTLYWHEHSVVLHSEFRDGNVPAGYEPVRVLAESLQALPKGVEKVCLRTDTAGYDHKLLRFCAEGCSDFGVIEFAIGVDVTAAFKAAVAEVSEWQPLSREVEGRREPTGQEWAEVCFVPSWAATKKDGPSYRFLAIREPLAQAELPGVEPAQLPFPTMRFEEGRYKVFGVVTNRMLPGEEVIHWHRERCGKGEEVHAVMKNDLAGGQLPSGLFGANAAWWAIVVLAFNLNALMTHLVLPEGWASRRLKALRFALIGVAGRVLGHARRLIVRLAEDHPASSLLLEVRSRILRLAPVPTG